MFMMSTTNVPLPNETLLTHCTSHYAEFDFPVRDHVEIGESLGLLDFRYTVQCVLAWILVVTTVTVISLV